MRGARLVSITALSIGLLASLPSIAEDYFAGKTISLSTHTGPGGGYDLYVRLVARHMGRHIPGRPNMVAVNQPGAGGLLAVNHAGRVAPQDGTWMTLVSQGLPVHEATGQPGLRISLKDLNWIGNLSRSNHVLVTWHTSKVATIDSAKETVASLGTTGAGSIATQLPASYNSLLGTKFKLISGYDGTGQMNVAMERGEIDGRGSNTWASYKATMPNEIRDKKLNVLLQVGIEKDPDLPNVPLLLDLVGEDPAKAAVARFLSLSVLVGRPIATPPGVPAERIIVLRNAFNATMKDNHFLSEATRLGAEIDPMSGADIHRVIVQLLTTPKEVIKNVKDAIAEGMKGR